MLQPLADGATQRVATAYVLNTACPFRESFPIAIPRVTPAVLAWLGVVAHVAVFAARRYDASSALPRPIVALNLIVALGVLAYWAPVWYGYAARGVTWYATDQAVPLYAALVAFACALTLAGRFVGRGAQVVHWGVFAVDALVFAAAALYLTFARFDRLF